MKVFLASAFSKKYLYNDIQNSPYLLESFYYYQDWEDILLETTEMFLLDSGAFTFMNSCKDKVDFDIYIDKYIDFINNKDIQYFFELDIDSIVGYEKVLQLRKRLERKTGKKCIPVWHKSRGLDEYIKICKEYDYIAIGGIAANEIKRSEYKYFDSLLAIARKYKCKVHGLGFTNMKMLSKYPFYSVDSSSWVNGARFGQFHLFSNNTIIQKSFKETKRAKGKELDKHNLCQWIKYQHYADKFIGG